VPVVTDFYKGQGPLAGLHAGLQGADSQEAVCLIGCDLPFMRAEVFRGLHRVLEADPHLQAVVPSDEGHLYPVCAVYRGNVREIAAQCLQQNHNSMRRFLEQLRVAYVPAGKWQDLLPSPFLNMNTPEDFEQACRLHSLLHTERSE
jgi:molybdopterin-guanine dinucleotide biosynthesis protein A